jgi:hypothetical protein
VGWGIGGAALIGGGLLASSKNKKIAQEAEEKTKKIKGETDVIKRIKMGQSFFLCDTPATYSAA